MDSVGTTGAKVPSGGDVTDEMEVAGIKFAPVKVPLKRRLQTLAAAAWFIVMAFGGFICIFFTVYLVLFTRLWWLTSIYLFWVYVDRDISEKGGRPSPWVQSWSWWKYLRDYFPLRLERLPWVELDPKKNYLFCVFPHGMLSTGAFSAFATSYGGFQCFFPRHTPRVVTLTQHYWTPFFRELGLSLGGIASTAESIDYVLSRPEGGHVCVLMPGGAAEAYYCKPGQYKVVLNCRRGFVKLALKNGTPLVPVISFGETDLFDQVEGPHLRKLQETVRKYLGMAPAVPIGRGFFQYSFGMVPRRKPVVTVVGVPLEVPKIQTPTKEDIEKYHSQFVQHLKKMFDEQKYNYLEDPEKKHLEIAY